MYSLSKCTLLYNYTNGMLYFFVKIFVIFKNSNNENKTQSKGVLVLTAEACWHSKKVSAISYSRKFRANGPREK